MITWGERKSKFHATKVTIDGIVFDSKGEGSRYQELILLEKAGHIKNLQLQVPFELQPSFRKRGKTYRAINYIADFVYEQDGITIVEDFKGFKNDTYLLKQKLFEYKFQTLFLLETEARSSRKTNTVRTVVAKPKGAGNKIMKGTQQWR